MKLTKSQRLFIQVGEALACEKHLKRTHKLGITAEHVPQNIAAYKCRKKKLLREALAADLTPYPCLGLDDLVKQGMELEAKGYKMRHELVHKDDKYFIIFERNEKEMSNE